ncbi:MULTISPECIES: phosphotransferase-like protein [Paenibacillus]|uniref:phosphotransferase-like protein n=1 Tax=Paenibacillus illinoisensis TaxID=59845 RepID=UPI001C8EAF7B|nr:MULTISPECIES: AAA family ATPase [Paenibacillus]MBY0216271.1 AAA family ATPase [Paenibacillus illinoisensis]WJH30659.1 chloramphenicol phosphotransferase CPT family protein [Paenibacillus sp. CC-CFT742]
MDKGRIIFLNGVTSSGKTSIVEAMQTYSEPFFYVVANDLFENTIGDKHLQDNYWKHLSEAIMMMYHTATLFSDHGKNILIDGILVERPELKPHYDKVIEIFNGYPLDIVEVYCPLDICRKRNVERGDRREDQSDEQNKLMSHNIRYSCSVDTSLNTPEECAEIIITSLFQNDK